MSMDVKTFISKFDNHPILFLGAGISKRYCGQSLTWDELLHEISNIVYGDDNAYYTLCFEYNSDNLLVAEQLEKDFNELCLYKKASELIATREQFYAAMKVGIKQSPFKIYIADKFKTYNINSDKIVEIGMMKQALENVCSIISTNYDGFIEKELGFKSLVGNDILLSNPFGSVYKIHGCYSQPQSLIITKTDYKQFDIQYELIRSELVSMFIHHPIIFIGYGFRDENIQKIVNTIFKYVSPNSKQAEQIRDRFLVVEYKEGVQDTIVEDYVVTCDKLEIRLNKVSTDNFIKIYQSIKSLKLKMSVNDVRRIQILMQQAIEGQRIVTFDPNSDIQEQDTEGIISIGMTTYTNLKAVDFRVKYFEYIEKKNKQILKVIDSIQSPKSHFFPIFGYLKILPDLQTGSQKMRNQLNKIKKIKSKVQGKTAYSHSTITEIMQDTHIPKSSQCDAIIYCALYDKISKEDLKAYVQRLDKADANYNRLLALYDYIEYCPESKKIK